jgi:hypothetical protein
MKPANISRLSPLRRGFVIGYQRGRHKAQAELEALRHDYHALALKLHRDCYERALDAAIMQRAMDANIVLH